MDRDHPLLAYPNLVVVRLGMTTFVKKKLAVASCRIVEEKVGPLPKIHMLPRLQTEGKGYSAHGGWPIQPVHPRVGTHDPFILSGEGGQRQQAEPHSL
jgi:hypothetical protein